MRNLNLPAKSQNSSMKPSLKRRQSPGLYQNQAPKGAKAPGYTKTKPPKAPKSRIPVRNQAPKGTNPPGKSFLPQLSMLLIISHTSSLILLIHKYYLWLMFLSFFVAIACIAHNDYVIANLYLSCCCPVKANHA